MMVIDDMVRYISNVHTRKQHERSHPPPKETNQSSMYYQIVYLLPFPNAEASGTTPTLMMSFSRLMVVVSYYAMLSCLNCGIVVLLLCWCRGHLRFVRERRSLSR